MGATQRGYVRLVRLGGSARPLLLIGFALGLALALAVAGCGGGLLDQARSKEQARDLVGADRFYEQLLRSDPTNLDALRGLAVNLSLLGRFDEALPYQEKVVRADPKDAQTRVELGFNYLNHQGRSRDALRVLEEAAALAPSARNRSFVAQARVGAGDTSGAEHDLRAVINDDPSYPFAYSLLIQLLEKQGRGGEAAAVKHSAVDHGIQLVDSAT